MENEIRTWLSDIKQAIEEINLFLPDTRDFFAFRNDLKTRRAIERNVEIIGEAVSSILKVDPDIKNAVEAKITGLRPSRRFYNPFCYEEARAMPL